jgi:hypothetical protein
MKKLSFGAFASMKIPTETLRGIAGGKAIPGVLYGGANDGTYSEGGYHSAGFSFTHDSHRGNIWTFGGSQTTTPPVNP